MPAPIPSPREQTIPSAANLFKIGVLVALLLGSFYFAVACAAWFDARNWSAFTIGIAKWTFIGILAIANVVFLIGLGILAHDAVHRVLFRTPFWNEVAGSLLSASALIPFYANRQFHLTHHSTAHQPGLDPENNMHRYPFLFSLSIGSVIALLEQYRYFYNNVKRVSDRRYTGRVLKDGLSLMICGAGYFWVTPYVLGLPLAYTVMPTLSVFPLVFGWRALSDHYGVPPIERGSRQAQPVLDVDEEAWHRGHERRQREISGWVVLTYPWFEWLWSNVNYHEVHHKYPWLSHHYLKPVFHATRADQPYLVINGYWRSLLNLRRRSYYGLPADTKQFLTTPDW